MKDYLKPYAKYVAMITENVSSDVDDKQEVVSSDFNDDDFE